MAKRKKPYSKRPFESTGENSDTSANIYMSMLTSDAFMDLSARQQILYVYMKSRYYGQKPYQKQKLYEQFEGIDTPVNVEESFSLTRGNVTKDWGLYSEGNRGAFYNDIEALIMHGFIKCVACGAKAKKKSIYRYSDKWRLWGSSDFEITREEMTSAMRRRLKKD